MHEEKPLIMGILKSLLEMRARTVALKEILLDQEREVLALCRIQITNLVIEAMRIIITQEIIVSKQRAEAH